METLLKLLNVMGILGMESQARLELSVLYRIARDIDRSAQRVDNLRSMMPNGPSIHARLVNASMQVKVATGNLKLLIVENRGER